MLQKKLGQRVADLRKARRLTQPELAKRVGCSVEFISLVERGVNAPSVAGLEAFAKALNAEVVDLFTFSQRARSRKPHPAKRN
jgi:transcriptional regulator with XRE-family HTH domain